MMRKKEKNTHALVKSSVIAVSVLLFVLFLYHYPFTKQNAIEVIGSNLQIAMTTTKPKFQPFSLLPRERRADTAKYILHTEPLPPNVPLDSIVRKLLPEINKDSSITQRMRAIALSRCALVSRDSDIEFENRWIEFQANLAESTSYNRIQYDSSYAASNVQTAIREQKALLSTCAGVDPGLVESWLKLLERAALLGDRDAKWDYVQMALAEFNDKGIPINMLDEATRRRDQMKTFAEDLLAEGDCNILGPLSGISSEPMLVYIYRLAALRQLKKDAANNGGELDQNVSKTLEDNRAKLSLLDQQKSELAAEEIISTYCQK